MNGAEAAGADTETSAAGAEEAGAGPTYYDRPVLKEPVWIWSVPAYFTVGGVAAGAALLGAVAQAADRRELDRLVRRCRDLALGGTALSTAFLIEDLGRPARFLNMLRVFRPSSAMSMGSWILAASGTTSGAAAVLPRLGLRRLGDAAGLASGGLAPALGTYTAVLLSDTAVPVWQATRRHTPALFAASSLASATAALDLLEQGPREARILGRLGIAARAAELAAGEAVERAADGHERVGRPLHQGLAGDLWRAAKALTAGSVAVSLLPVPRRWRARRRRAAGLLGLAGSAAVRFSLFHAGRASARDPRATFSPQRAGAAGAGADETRPVTR